MHNFVYLAQRRSQEFSCKPNFGACPPASPWLRHWLFCYSQTIQSVHQLLAAFLTLYLSRLSPISSRYMCVRRRRRRSSMRTIKIRGANEEPWCKIDTLLLHTTNMKYHIGYRFVPFPMTFNDPEGHSPAAGVIECNSTNICATFRTVSTDTARRAVRRR